MTGAEMRESSVWTLRQMRTLQWTPFYVKEDLDPDDMHTTKWGDMRGGTIRARVRRGLLEPLEKIDLPEGKEVTIAVLESLTELNVDAFRRAAGSWKGGVDAPS